MDVRVFETTQGPVPVWGEFKRFSPERRLLFVIRGAWPPTVDYLDPLSDLVPEADVALVHLPGMHTRPFEDQSVDAFAAAFDQVIAELAHPDVVILGISIGGVVALSLAGGWDMILVETPLLTLPLWPIHQRLRGIAQNNPKAAEWIYNIFGTTQLGVEGRDYRFLAGRFEHHATVLLGDDPLGTERLVERVPSLVCHDSLKAYAANPHFRAITIANTGHNIPKEGFGRLLHVLHTTLSSYND